MRKDTHDCFVNQIPVFSLRRQNPDTAPIPPWMETALQASKVALYPTLKLFISLKMNKAPNLYKNSCT